MNVLLVNPYRLDAGGLTTMVLRLREGLAARGHKALVLAAADTDQVQSLPGTGAYGIYLRRVRQPGAVIRPFAGFLLGLGPSLRTLATFLRREEIDVVHFHFPVPASLYFATLRPRARWKLIATFHGTDGHTLGERSPWYRALLRLSLSRADAVTAVSGELLSVVTRFFPGIARRSRVVLNGNPIESTGTGATPTPPFGLPSGYALAVGSLMAVKGYDILARAVRIARDRGHDLHVVVVGDGPEAASLRRLVGELEIADRMHFIGEVPYQAMVGLYAGARFLAHAARREGFGLVVLEAMACRKAVVAPRVGGIPEFVRHEETGLLVEPEDPAALAAAMIRLDGDPALRERLATHAWEYATRERSWARVVDEYEAVYRDALAGG